MPRAIFASCLAIACATMVLVAATASAALAGARAPGAATTSQYTLRVPQVLFDSATLRGIFLSNAGQDGAIDPATDQITLATVPPDAAFCLGFSLTLMEPADPGMFAIGCYSTGEPTPVLRPLLPAGAPMGTTAVCEVHLRPHGTGTMFVTLYDPSWNVIGSASYALVDSTPMALYITGPHGTVYTEDWRNGGSPQALMYWGGWGSTFRATHFLCFEQERFNPATSRFVDAVLAISPMGSCDIGLPAHASTWGNLKSRYR